MEDDALAGVGVSGGRVIWSPNTRRAVAAEIRPPGLANSITERALCVISTPEAVHSARSRALINHVPSSRHMTL
ncbi:hypothetical protein ABT174_40625 [Streptomyces sparsogenes]|uniref:hypothetical protein n=1 Tax=Streptomyces sparsogenes TaxID=67365 RepID=UPI0033253410